jgi:dTDP-glucose 4,6-dehydratase
VAHRNNVKRVIQVSTDEVYGSIENGSWNEESTLKPNSPYSASKASADLLARSYFKTFGLDLIITRSCNNYGPYQHHEKLIPQLISRIQQGKSLPIYGDGLNIREWIHVSDHARAIGLLAVKGTSGDVYNIGSSEEFTNLEIANKLLSLVPESSSKIEFVKDRLGHDFRYSLHALKIEDLGFKLTIGFEKGIAETIDWYKK